MLVPVVIVFMTCTRVIRGNWEEVEEALSLQQAKRVTKANLSILVESWVGNSDYGVLNVTSPMACLVYKHVMKVVQSWKLSKMVYCSRYGNSCQEPMSIVNPMATECSTKNFSPDIYIRIGRNPAMRQENRSDSESLARGGIFNALLLGDQDIKIMLEQKMSYFTQRNQMEIEGLEKVLLFSDNVKKAGSSGRGSRELAKLFPYAGKSTPPLSLSLLCEPRTAEDLQITTALNESLMSGIINAQFHRYVSANIDIMRSQLSWSTSLAAQSHRLGPSAQRPLKAVAVVVEPRIVPSFEFSVRNVMHHLLRSSLSNVEWKLHVYSSPGPAGNEHFVKSVLSDMPSSLVKFIRLPRTFDRDGGKGYNQLLKSSSFWKRLLSYGFSTALIFQADSILVDTARLGEFFMYDFVGAPWMTKRADYGTSKAQSSGEPLIAHLQCCNGGLSLRNVQSMYRISSERRSLNPKVNEDLFFSSYMEEFKLRSPDILHAFNFSLEKPPSGDRFRGTMNELSAFEPSGLHAAWAYNDHEVIEKLFKKSCKNLSIQCK